MKNVKLTSFLCGSALALTTGGVFAQQSSQTPPSSSPSSSPQSSQSQYGAGSQSQSGQRQSGQTTPGSLGTHSGLGESSSALDASRSSMDSGNNVRLSQLMHSSVQSQEGKTLGQIRDLTVDPKSGRIEFAILSLSSAGAATDTSTSGRETVPSNRSSNIGTPSTATTAAGTGKLIPVPWQLLNQSFSSRGIGSSTTSSAMGSQNLVLNIDESKLRTAPSFDAGSWNQLQTGSFDQQVYSHFGVDRSTATGTPGSSVTGQGTSGSSSSSLQQPYSGSSSQQPQSGSSHSTSPQGSSSSSSPQPQSGSQGSSSSSPQPQSGSSPQSGSQGSSSSSPDR